MQQGAARARFNWEVVDDPAVKGYMVYWGTESGVYTHTFDAGNTTEVIIEAFTEGVEYFTVITAYDDTGVQSDYSVEVSFVYDSTDRMILLEAENGVLAAPMQVVSDTANSWVAASSALGSAATTLSFETPSAADYYVWCRVFAPSGSADSMYVTVDQQAEEVYDVYGEPSPPPSDFVNGWTWSRIQVSRGIARAYVIDSGYHSIRFRYRENTWLDRVVIVSNPDFVPTDALPRSGDFVAVVDQPQGGSVIEGGAVTLTPTFVSTGPISLQWFYNGIPIPGTPQISLVLSNLQVSESGSYMLMAWNNSASAATQPSTVSVMPVAGATPPFRVSALRVAGGGQVTFEVEGTLPQTLGIYASNDLKNWSLLETQALTGNTLTLIDPEAAKSPKRFYRLADGAQP